MSLDKHKRCIDRKQRLTTGNLEVGVAFQIAAVES